MSQSGDLGCITCEDGDKKAVALSALSGISIEELRS